MFDEMTDNEMSAVAWIVVRSGRSG